MIVVFMVTALPFERMLYWAVSLVIVPDHLKYELWDPTESPPLRLIRLGSRDSECLYLPNQLFCL